MRKVIAIAVLSISACSSDRPMRNCAEFIERQTPLHSCVHVDWTDIACFQSPDEAAIWVRDQHIALCYDLTADAGR